MENKIKTAQDWIDESEDKESEYKKLFYPELFEIEQAERNISKILREMKGGIDENGEKNIRDK